MKNLSFLKGKGKSQDIGDEVQKINLTNVTILSEVGYVQMYVPYM